MSQAAITHLPPLLNRVNTSLSKNSGPLLSPSIIFSPDVPNNSLSSSSPTNININMERTRKIDNNNQKFKNLKNHLKNQSQNTGR